MANLNTEFCGLNFKNPIVVASAEPGNSVDNMKKCIDHGAGGIIIKTIGDIPGMQTLTKHSKYAILNDRGQPIQGKVNRNFFFYSRSGYVSEPYQEWIPILAESQQYAHENGSHIIGNIASATIDGWVMLAKMLEDCGIPLIELNYQCPHPTDFKGQTEGIWIAQDANVTAELTERILEAVDIPVMVKLTPETHNLTDIARAASDAGTASVAVNSRFVGFAVDIDNAKPYIDGLAGIGGPWVKYMTLRWIHDIYSKHGIPMSASNGVYDGRDAIEFFMTGARIMQVCSVLMLKGIEWLPKIIAGMEKFLDEQGYPDLESIYGIASRRAKSPAEFFEATPVYSLVDHDKCKTPRCTICAKVCFYDAMHIVNDRMVVDPERCIGCELCQSVCAFDSITLTEDKQQVALNV
jgi:dihydroorotate dehydrogenase (fumarate)/dihydropyrimidine dehydrogenase (NAD+) subunit PreA